ncbi:hypothetical protein ACWDOP_09925 [Nocardia sp. NPDC003693]
MTVNQTPPVRVSRAWRTGMAVVTAAAGCVCLWVLWQHAISFDDVELYPPAVALLAILLVPWLIYAVAGRFAPGTRRLTRLLPAIVAVSAVLLGFHVPGRVGWIFSGPAMERAALACVETEDRTRVGTYVFTSVDRTTDACVFRQERPMGYRTGFIHRMSGAPLRADHPFDCLIDDSWLFFTVVP